MIRVPAGVLMQDSGRCGEQKLFSPEDFDMVPLGRAMYKSGKMYAEHLTGHGERTQFP